MESIDKIIGYLNQLYGLPAVALVAFSCVAVGYVLRTVKRFPNDGIPLAVILWGAIAMSLVADARANNMSLRVWICRNVLVGLVVGFASWMLHRVVLSRVEDWIVSKFPDLGNTTIFRRSDVPNPPLTTPPGGTIPEQQSTSQK